PRSRRPAEGTSPRECRGGSRRNHPARRQGPRAGPDCRRPGPAFRRCQRRPGVRRMSALWTAAEIAAACDGTVHGDFEAQGVTFDSREVQPGDLFIALKGEATDGHRFVEKAFKAGASGVLVAEKVDGPCVVVGDTSRALNDLGRAARARSSARIIGVTGSVGKTSTKEALYAALDRA